MIFDDDIMDDRDAEMARHLDSLTLTELAEFEAGDRYPPASCDGSLVQAESLVQRRRRPCS